MFTPQQTHRVPCQADEDRPLSPAVDCLMAPVITKCPKCAHVRTPGETAAPERCPACGVYFKKWAFRDTAVRTSANGRTETTHAEIDKPESVWRSALHERLTNIPGRGNLSQFYSRAFMLTMFLIWGIRLSRMDYRDGSMGGSFMHNILLIIHEAGHVLFMPFGQFMTILGGSLFQLLLPLIVAATILWQNRDPFGAALGVWWCGVSLMDLAPYIYDALRPTLTMLGGHTGEDGPHDWIYLLGAFNRIAQSQTYGGIVHKLGVVVMLAASAAAALVLWRMWLARNDKPEAESLPEL
ncbi:hypothetical protein BH11PSE11_BH11PSE11_36290 [soil metagenome]